ncbi:Protein of unknown function [Geodermatophilus pulveris]|uniref:DUF2510 domain-containing protein n=1 Tax=Geodermatophilus pulveris TaxID=1564159 RepID=A0A239B5C4_9ACTN|nr:DUF2510 domain-containing protein [Geodermatophilus pulveris]SNS02792.1 Protein of unknown function [Geodermatophilus pulveris]
MSGQSSAPAGWYPDPDGAPATLRWWDGAGWSDVTSSAGPGVAVQAPAPGPPTGTQPPAPGPPRSGRTPWVVGLSVLGLVLVVLVGFLVGRPSTGSDRDEAGAAASSPTGPAFPPGTVRIVDEAAGIAYPHLGEGWFEYDLDDVAETTSTAGQYLVTQEVTPDGGPFIAQCTSGPLAPAFGWSGPDSLRSTLAQVATTVRLDYYPLPNEVEVRRDEARTVDGAPAHLVEFDLSWDVEGFQATGERAALLLVDVGRPAPALLYVSVPNTHAELYGVVDRVIEAVEVL